MFDNITINSTILRHQDLTLKGQIVSSVISHVFANAVYNFIMKKALPFAISSVDNAIGKLKRLCHCNQNESSNYIIARLKNDAKNFFNYRLGQYTNLKKSLLILRHYMLLEIGRSVLDRIIVRSILLLKRSILN